MADSLLQAMNGAAPAAGGGLLDAMSGSQIKDDALHAVKALASSPAGRTVGAGVGKVMDLLGRPGVATQALLSGDGSVGDFARAGNAFAHGVSPEDQQANRDTIKSGLHIKDAIDKLPEGLARGTADAAVDTALDPTTYLGGLGLIEKGMNATGKAVLYGGIKGANAAQHVGARAVSSRPVTQLARIARGGERLDPADVERGFAKAGSVGAAAFDALTPKGKLTRQAIQASRFDPNKPLSSINKPFDDVAKASTIKAKAVNTQRGITAAGQKSFDAAVKGLTPDDERSLYQAIDRGDTAALSPEMQKRAATISDLYRGVLHLEGTGTVKKDLGKAGFALPGELAPFDTQTRGIFNRANVRSPYLPHGQRFSGQDLEEIKGDSTPGISAEDLLGAAKAAPESKPGSMLGDKDLNKLSRDDVSKLQDVVRQREINRARFASAGRAIGAKDAARALAKEFGTAVPIMRTIRAEKADTGEIYQMAMSGLAPEEKRVVNMLQQGASPDDVAKRMGWEPGSISNNLQQRAQTVRDAIGGYREPTVVDTGRTRQSFEGVPNYIRQSFQRESKSNHPAMLAARGVKAIADAPKYGFFGVPFRHMANIATMGALADPRATALATGRFALAHPEATGAVAGGVGGYAEDGLPGAAIGAAAGALGGRGIKMTGLSKQAAESQERAVQSATKGGAIDFNPDEQIPGPIRNLPGISQLYGASNRFLWGYDEAVKAARYDSLVKRGVAPHAAAQRVSEDLMNYGDKSVLTKGLSYAAPFAGYRSKLPGVIARAVARNPERPLMANRMAPALAGEDQPADDGGMVRSYLPLAEILRATQHPAEYARATLSAPYKDAVAAIGDATMRSKEDQRVGSGRWMLGWNQDQRRYNTIPEVLPTQAIGSIPGADELLAALHWNPYAARGLPTDLIEGSTALRYFPPR